MIAVELNLPARDPYLDFQGNYEVREQYINWMVKSLKSKYQRAIENYPWQIFLVIGQPVLEPQQELYEHT